MEGERIMGPIHGWFIFAGLIVGVIRLILRSVFVILTESPLVIPLITTSLLSIAFLIILQRKGGCGPTLLYFVVEPLFCTIWWFLLIFALDTNQICHELGSDVCEDVSL